MFSFYLPVPSSSCILAVWFFDVLSQMTLIIHSASTWSRWPLCMYFEVWLVSKSGCIICGKSWYLGFYFLFLCVLRWILPKCCTTLEPPWPSLPACCLCAFSRRWRTGWPKPRRSIDEVTFVWAWPWWLWSPWCWVSFKITFEWFKQTLDLLQHLHPSRSL